jgi:predicted ribosomally synthesized peptide with SipW-like signal peptide
MKKIIGLAIAALIVIAVAGVGSFAYFSDTEKAAGNAITAGTLYLTPSATKVISLAADTNGTLAPGTGSTDEKISLAPVGTINTGNYLSLKMTNLYDNATGYVNTGSNSLVHDLSGTAISHTAGDLGTKAKLLMWLSTSSSSSAPANGDIVLVPPASTNGLGTMHTWAGGDSYATLSKTWAAYTGQTASPLSSGSTNYAAWDNSLGAQMGTTTWYFHCTWSFPDDTVNDNVYQGVALSYDLYFTLATSNAPY